MLLIFLGIKIIVSSIQWYLTPYHIIPYSILSFSHNLSYPPIQSSNSLPTHKISTLFHSIPTSKDPLEKHRGKGRKCCLPAFTSIFSFSHSVFNSFKERNHHFTNKILSSANAVILVTPEILSFSKELNWTKFKAFADNKWTAVKVFVSCFDRVENIVRKGENAGFQHFLLFPQCF